MKIFVCEFITGGGLHDQELPPSLAREGLMMLQAVVSDLLQSPVFDVSYTLDERLTVNLSQNPAERIQPDTLIWPLWEQCLAAADCCIIIAPETDDLLHKITRLAEDNGCLVLGSDHYSVQLCSSKIQTYEHLKEYLHCPDYSSSIDALVFDSKNQWVMKPDDGAGAEHCYLVNEQHEIPQFQQRSSVVSSWLYQQYLPGICGSISVCNINNTIAILAINQLHTQISNGRLFVTAIEVNALQELLASVVGYVEIIVEKIPGLSGLFGIDFVWHKQTLYLLEINPRITTAYVGLTQSLGFSPLSLYDDTQIETSLEQLSQINPTPIMVNL